MFRSVQVDVKRNPFKTDKKKMDWYWREALLLWSGKEKSLKFAAALCLGSSEVWGQLFSFLLCTRTLLVGLTGGN